MKTLILVSVALSLASCDVTVPVTRHWNQGFEAKVCFDITEEMTQWKINLKFDQPVDHIDAPVADVSGSGTDYTLSSRSWNGDEHTGDELCLRFLGQTSHDMTPVITATLEGAPGGGSGSHVQTTAPPHNQQTPASTASLAPGQSTPASVTVPAQLKPVGDGITSTMEVRNDWGNKFEGWFDFDFPTDYLGWLMKIRFSKPVASIQPSQARIMSHNADGTEWTLANDDNTLFVQAGKHWQLRTVNTLAAGDTSGAPQATALLINLGKDNWTCPEVPDKTPKAKYNLYDALGKSILFYEAQRSGKLPADNRIPWRGDSALDDHGDNGEDLSGGWYDAGDYVKFNFPMAWATTILEWGFLEFKDAYDAAGQTSWFCKQVKWPLDYFIKCHVADDVLYGQVGDGGTDHGSWGRPEEMTMKRPAFKIDASNPGSDLAMQTAAAFAAGYLVFKDGPCQDASYAATLLAHAKTLWEFGIKHQGKYTGAIPAGQFYQSNNVTDENCWGSLWLYKATGEQKYLDTAKQWYDSAPDWGMSWDDNFIGTQILMYELTKDDKYKADVEGTFKFWFPGGSVPYTPKGLAFRLQWGSLRYASNMAFAALVAANKGVNSAQYRQWAMCQIYYTLGDAGHSFVVGFGKNPPVSPHHRSSSCPWPPALCNLNVVHLDGPNVHPLCGALVGGPGKSDDYTDSRGNYVNNEVANDYNAGFQGALAGLVHLLVNKEMPDESACPYSSR